MTRHNRRAQIRKTRDDDGVGEGEGKEEEEKEATPEKDAEGNDAKMFFCFLSPFPFPFVVVFFSSLSVSSLVSFFTFSSGDETASADLCIRTTSLVCLFAS